MEDGPDLRSAAISTDTLNLITSSNGRLLLKLVYFSPLLSQHRLIINNMLRLFIFRLQLQTLAFFGGGCFIFPWSSLRWCSVSALSCSVWAGEDGLCDQGSFGVVFVKLTT